MSEERLILSPKFKAYLRCNAPVEFLEGTTAAGKTTVGIFKFILRVADSPKKLHILAAKDVGTAEKNIINKDLGIIITGTERKMTGCHISCSTRRKVTRSST